MEDIRDIMSPHGLPKRFRAPFDHYFQVLAITAIGFFQLHLVVEQPLDPGRLPDRLEQLGAADGFGQVVVRPGAYRFHRRIEAGFTGYDDDLYGFIYVSEPVEEINSRDTGHDDVGDDHIEVHP